MRILVVDDTPHILQDLKEALEESNCDVKTASSIEEAQEEISKHEFDYAIIDLKLDFTGYGGLEVFKFAKQQQPNLKPIILSGYAFQRVKEQLKKQSQSTSQGEEANRILDEIEHHYIYKGGKRNYIDVVLESLGVEDTTSPWYGDYHALLIAVQSYEHSSITKLEYPIADTERLKSILARHYIFDETRIKVLKDPTRQEILAELFNLSEELTSKDNLLIFYAGHGCWNDSRQQGYWLPRDATEDNPANWISNGDIRDYVQGIKTQHTLLIADACFGGAIFKTRSAPTGSKTIKEKYRTQSRRAMTSGDAIQTVPDRSIFLDYLIDHLENSQDQYLYAEKLFVKICDAFIYSNLTEQNPVYGKIQRTGDKVGGDFIFIKR